MAGIAVEDIKAGTEVESIRCMGCGYELAFNEFVAGSACKVLKCSKCNTVIKFKRYKNKKVTLRRV